MPHMAQTMHEVGLRDLPEGMRRFIDIASELAVVPATIMPRSPMVYA